MKWLFLASLVAFFSACTSDNVSIGSRTTAEVDRIYDAGTVTKGEIIKAKINVKNTGDIPLVIGDVEVGCSCTLAKKPDEPIKPGKVGVVEASVDTDKIGVGKFSRDIRIISNTTPSPLIVSIQGEIVQ